MFIEDTDLKLNNVKIAWTKLGKELHVLLIITLFKLNTVKIIFKLVWKYKTRFMNKNDNGMLSILRYWAVTRRIQSSLVKNVMESWLFILDYSSTVLYKMWKHLFTPHAKRKQRQTRIWR